MFWFYCMWWQWHYDTYMKWYVICNLCITTTEYIYNERCNISCSILSQVDYVADCRLHADIILHTWAHTNGIISQLIFLDKHTPLDYTLAWKAFGPHEMTACFHKRYPKQRDCSSAVAYILSRLPTSGPTVHWLQFPVGTYCTCFILHLIALFL